MKKLFALLAGLLIAGATAGIVFILWLMGGDNNAIS